MAVLLEDEGPRLLGRGGVSPLPCPAVPAKTAQRSPDGPWSSPPGGALMRPPHPLQPHTLSGFTLVTLPLAR